MSTRIINIHEGGCDKLQCRTNERIPAKIQHYLAAKWRLICSLAKQQLLKMSQNIQIYYDAETVEREVYDRLDVIIIIAETFVQQWKS